MKSANSRQVTGTTPRDADRVNWMILGTNGATTSSRRCRLEGLPAGADALLNLVHRHERRTERRFAKDRFRPRAVDLHLGNVLDVGRQGARHVDPVFGEAGKVLGAETLQEICVPL